MTTAERKDLIGQMVKYHTVNEGFLIEVNVLDHKVTYGRDRYLITPTWNKTSSKWVENIFRTDDLSQI